MRHHLKAERIAPVFIHPNAVGVTLKGEGVTTEGRAEVDRTHHSKVVGHFEQKLKIPSVNVSMAIKMKLLVQLINI